MMHILSLGAGVQSTTMALMAAHGEIEPMPDCAIFADTGWEPRAVYDHLAWLMSGVLPYPVHIVSAGNIREDLLARRSARGGRFLTIPAFQLNGMGKRQCTTQYKIDPLKHKTRELLGVTRRGVLPPGAVTTWIGISVDEIIRATPSRVRYQIKRFPLIEQRMNRGDCLEWLKRRDHRVPSKSACIGCPFHDNAGWREIKAHPDEWSQALEVDASLRAEGRQQYLHRSLKPLDEVDLSTAEDRGQLNLFNNECEGMCGV